MGSKRTIIFTILFAGFLFFVSCDNFYKNDYYDNSPTSGRLKVRCDEGIEPHARNQVYTFESQYPNAHVELRSMSEDACVLSLYYDSCESVLISRLLSEREKQLFASRTYTPRYTAVAHSGVAIICNSGDAFGVIDEREMPALLIGAGSIVDSTGRKQEIRIVIDRNNSSVMRYLSDSILKGEKFGAHCSSLGSSRETIEYVTGHRGALGIIDFAWLSDTDDDFFKKQKGAIRFLPVRNKEGETVLPSQSAFKTGQYAFTRTIYVMHKTGDFSLAKGFAGFVAGPKGQLTFLKQGLMPARQAERTIEINMEPPAGQ